MLRTLMTLAALAIPLALLAAPPGGPKPAAAPFFNGKDLTGWVNVNCAPNTFRVEAGQIVTTGKPTGYMRTAKHYENFELEFEWKHTNTKDVGNSGLFAWGDALPAVGTGYTRSIEVQVLVNLEVKDTYTSHGDLFSIWGASCKPARPHPKGWERCLPSENRAKGGGEWNHYRVVGNDGKLTLAVNGKVVSEVSACKPRKGYLALESEGAECTFRNFAMKELPSTDPKPEEVATLDAGHVSLFNGVDLTGWESPTPGSWKAGETLRSTGIASLTTTAAPVGGELVFDWKMPGKGEQSYTFAFAHGVATVKGKAGEWHRAILPIPGGKTPPEGFPTVSFPGQAGLELRNVFARQKQ